jgi:2-hydroxy-3-keto-5-methylthiopentenyl-1-phosphate phosphatase
MSQLVLDNHDLIVSNSEKTEQFLQRINLQSSVWVFDFDGTLIHKWFNSFAPIDKSEKDEHGELIHMKEYMICIENSRSYEELANNLESWSLGLPEEVRILTQSLTFQEFKNDQMNHRWDYTMQKAVERSVPMADFDLTDLFWRPWAKDLLQWLLDKGIQVLIISSWIWNLIRFAIDASGFDLNHHCLHIKSNDFILDERGNCADYDPDLITPFTKMHVDYHKYWISDKQFAIQAGDSLGDAQMVTEHFSPENILNVWFTNGKESKNNTFPDVFDIVFTEKDSSFEILTHLFLP